MRGAWSTPRPGRFSPGKETRYPLYRRLGGPQGRSGRVRKISPPPGFDPRTVQPVGSRYTDYAIPAHSVDGRWMKCEYGVLVEWWQREITRSCATFSTTNPTRNGLRRLTAWTTARPHSSGDCPDTDTFINTFLVLNIRDYSWVFKERIGFATFSALFLLSMTCLLSKGFTVQTLTITRSVTREISELPVTRTAAFKLQE